MPVTALGVSIRTTSSFEHSEIADLMHESYAEFERDLGRDNWRRMLNTVRSAPTIVPWATPIVAEAGGELVGFVNYVPPGRSDGNLFPKEWASVRLLGVKPEARGLRIGKRLLDECIRRAVADHGQVIGLCTSELMHVARGMYERRGFEMVRELELRYGIRYWTFQKSLRALSREAS